MNRSTHNGLTYRDAGVAIEAGDAKAAEAVLKSEQPIIDSIADKRIIHKNKAARHKSRLSAKVKALALKPAPETAAA